MKKCIIVPFLLLCFLSGCAAGRGDGQERVRSVILMIGDGMGLPQITALSIENAYAPLEIERAHCIGIQKTGSANNRVTDSAAAATAMACGGKTCNGMVGVAPDGTPLESVLDVAAENGKATGIVVTYAVTDATPAAFVAHVADRGDQETIALQYLDSGVDVIAGTGRSYFDGRRDGRDLIAEMRAYGYDFAPDSKALMSAGKAPLLALFDDMPYVVNDTLGIRGGYMGDATVKALELLEGTGKDGFFLMVESSLIDKGGHANDIAAVVAETADFDRAVGMAFDYADRHPGTLVLVTGDHETGGLTIVSPETDFRSADAGVEYRYSTTSHSATFIPVYAYGAGAEKFAGVMDNTDIAKRLKALLGA